MAKYVDGFVIPVPKSKIGTYREIAKRAGKVWMKHGALEYKECVGEDLKVKFGLPFPALAKAKAGETVVFSWILFKSRAHRDKVNAKVMKDPFIQEMMKAPPPFECKKMAYGGFEVLVDM